MERKSAQQLALEPVKMGIDISPLFDGTIRLLFTLSF